MFVNEMQASAFGCSEETIAIEVETPKCSLALFFLDRSYRIVAFRLMQIKEPWLWEDKPASIFCTHVCVTL